MRFLLLSIFVAAGCAGCASFSPPQPWEKGELAKPSMQFDPDVLQAKLRENTYASKEGAAGGYGVGGGGCGCN
jgi:Domain of unknown function (DUF4266)